MAGPSPLRVLLTNDDGPPGAHSPYIYGFYRYLVTEFGWDVRVVIPSSQKSWIGKAFHIAEIIEGVYYYPRDPDGSGETSPSPRPLNNGEVAQWILLDGTPATCANVGIHNLYPGEIDLVISGPNFGRNTSAAFALSSGTIGAALSSSLCQIRSLAVSYGTVGRPIPESYFHPAHALAGKIIQSLCAAWGQDSDIDTSNGTRSRNGEIDLYSINIPMVEGLIAPQGMKVAWTKLWRNSYGRLFKLHESKPANRMFNPDVGPGGPDADTKAIGTPVSTHHYQASGTPSESLSGGQSHPRLAFKFSPDMKDLINPTSVPVGTDAWAIAQGWASVTPLRASFAEPILDVSRPDVIEDEHKHDALSASDVTGGVKYFRFKL